jgi:hypothetical protein
MSNFTPPDRQEGAALRADDPRAVPERAQHVELGAPLARRAARVAAGSFGRDERVVARVEDRVAGLPCPATRENSP